MKKNLVFFATFIILMIPALSKATPPHPGPYMTGFLGLSIIQDANVTGFDYFVDQSFDERVEFDPGINIGATVGYDYGIIRLEGELSYKHGEISTISDKGGSYRYRNSDGTLGVLAKMFNAFLDLHNNSPVTPYLGGGIGFAAMHLSDTFVPGDPVPIYQEDDDSVFAYQVGGGLEVALNRLLSLDLGYRYFATTKARFGSKSDIVTELNFQGHNAAVGFRVNF